MAGSKRVQEEPKSEEAKGSDIESLVSKGVDAFVSKHLRNTPFSRDTSAWNHLHERLPALKEEIVQSIEKGGK